MVEIDTVILKEHSEPMQNDQDGEVEGAVNNLFTFPTTL